MEDTNQLIAINHITGPAIVIAGPGSGKTRVITKRTLNLTMNHNVNPEEILVVTFTRAAAAEMRDRYIKLCPETGLEHVTFGTFHSIFFGILRNATGLTAENILKERDADFFISTLIDKYNVETFDRAELIFKLKGEIGRVKADGGTRENYTAHSCNTYDFINIYNDYTDILNKRRLVDFEDMMIKTHDILKSDLNVLKKMQDAYRFIMVDEFQDINPMQYEIIKMLSAVHRNLFIVGDDDQSIYGFRGAEPGIMLKFPEDYRDAVKIVLNTNYRSKGNIVKASERLIKNNKTRFQKEIKPVKEPGEKVMVTQYETIDDEIQGIFEKISRYAAEGILYSQMCVILRTNALSAKFREGLKNRGIPVKYFGSDSIYDRFPAKDVITYIRVALGERSRSDVLSIINRPERYIMRETFTDETVDFEHVSEKLQNEGTIFKRYQKFLKDLDFIKRGTPLSAVTYIRYGVKFDRFAAEYARTHKMNPAEALMTLEAVEKDAKNFDSFSEWFFNIERKKNAENAEEALRDAYIKDTVNVMTMHGSKGLEFDVVFVPQANMGVTPYRDAVTEAEKEEERRMFYVAITRAKMALNLSYVRKIGKRRAEPSGYIKETGELKESSIKRV